MPPNKGNNQQKKQQEFEGNSDPKEKAPDTPGPEVPAPGVEAGSDAPVTEVPKAEQGRTLLLEQTYTVLELEPANTGTTVQERVKLFHAQRSEAEHAEFWRSGVTDVIKLHLNTPEVRGRLKTGDKVVIRFEVVSS